MFYILILIGSILIGLGIYKDRNEAMMPEPIALDEIAEIKERILNIEKIIFFDAHESEERENTSDASEKYELLRKYEDENYTMDQICTLLNMKKGEVLLLKNLFKNYQG